MTRFGLLGVAAFVAYHLGHGQLANGLPIVKHIWRAL